jgi:hypothetical protein
MNDEWNYAVMKEERWRSTNCWKENSCITAFSLYKVTIYLGHFYVLIEILYAPLAIMNIYS